MKRKIHLDRLFQEIEAVVLRRQHPVTGLLPASTSVNTHGNYTDAWVRDNVYSVMCVWCLGTAFRRFGDTDRCDQLNQSTIKLMRGLLMSMMRQAPKVEKFKHTLDKQDALHAKYDTATGLEVVADDAWGHLQLDATSLYLLMLAQMSASGLRIITTFDEVDFVQNLVYYVASAYRTQDFGIWERGNKINNGKTEINASSVGMAKAALQALDGFNLFGRDGNPRAVIHSVADSIALARSTLSSLLPRESLSKETDSALLSVIGFPAFAVGDKRLVTRTRDDILAKLGGNYGLKRFLWDGHQTVLEEASRPYYEHSELANFENIESEWPLFFCFLYIHALFDGNESTAKHYRSKLESLMVTDEGLQLLPELYYVPEEGIEREKQQPRSQPRVPNTNVPLVWAQSLYWVGYMLDEGLLSRDDIDPLFMRRRSRQHNKTHIALVVLAENDKVKTLLAQRGIMAETLPDIQPINPMSAQALVDIYHHVGANPTLGLSGRPHRRLQSLATSQTYEINGKQYLCLSWLQNDDEDYRVFDAEYLAQNIRKEINHIYSNWLSPAVAVFTWMVDEDFCHTHKADVLFETLRSLQVSHGDHVGFAAANFAYRASRVNQISVPGICVLSRRMSLRKGQLDSRFQKPEELSPEIQSILECLTVETDLTCWRTLEVFVGRRRLAERLGSGDGSCTVEELLQHAYVVAQHQGYWLVARYCFAALGRHYADLADGLTMLTVRHLRVVVGKSKGNSYVIDSVQSNADLLEGVSRTTGSALERTIVQELLSVIGNIMRTSPRLFDGLRSIQMQNLMMLCADATEDATDLDVTLSLGAMSPAQLFTTVHNILESQHRIYTRGISTNFIPDVPETGVADVVDTDWFEWRGARGSIMRLDDKFLQALWGALGQVPALVFGDRSNQEFRLDSELVRSSMTAGEVSFAAHVDHLLQQLHPTYYKCAVIEAIYGFILYCEQHPDVRFEQPILLAPLLESAARSYIWDSSDAPLGKRDLDVLLERPPRVLQEYVQQALENLALTAAVA